MENMENKNNDILLNVEDLHVQYDTSDGTAYAVNGISFQIKRGETFGLVGETGAGKTMLISAINGVLGERLSKDIIRTGEEKAYISALFSHIPPAARLQIEEKGYDLPEGELLISRELGARNSCKINGRPATLQILKEIASLLIDIHGQKDSHRLLDPAYHMEYIDSFGGLEEPLSAYQEQYRRTVELRKKLAGLSKNDREKQQRLDLLNYQIQEIQSARLEPGEEEELLALREKIRNSERIVKLAAASKGLIDGGEDLDGISAMAASLGDNLNALAAFLPELREAAEQVTEFSYLIGDIGSQVSRQAALAPNHGTDLLKGVFSGKAKLCHSNAWKSSCPLRRHGPVLVRQDICDNSMFM